MILPLRLKLKHEKPLPDQFLLHLSEVITPLTPYALMQEMYNLPYDSPNSFLKAHHIAGSEHFLEHCAILSQNIKLKNLISSQLLPLVYPLAIFVLSTGMFYGFRIQFSTLFIQMGSPLPSNHSVIIFFHSVMFVIALVIFLVLLWCNSAYYRTVLCLQQWRKTRLGKLVYEWSFFQVVCALHSLHIVFYDLASIMKAHVKHPIMTVMAYEIREYCEQGLTLTQWITSITTSQAMAYWIVDQIKTHNHKQLKNWQNQLFYAIQHYLLSTKITVSCVLYLGIGMNIIGMLALLSTPYSWITL